MVGPLHTGSLEIVPVYSNILAGIAVMFCTTLFAQELDDGALVDALRHGGCVIVMRHASSPRSEPDATSAAPGNVDRERQLDEKGRESAIAMGKAIKRLAIPVGELLSSPTFRALETATLLDLAKAEGIAELGEGGHGMRPDIEGDRSAWLRAKAAEPVPPGSNRLMISHYPNLVGAFGDAAAGITDGESLIIKPENGRAVVIARVKIERWPQFDSAWQTNR